MCIVISYVYTCFLHIHTTSSQISNISQPGRYTIENVLCILIILLVLLECTCEPWSKQARQNVRMMMGLDQTSESGLQSHWTRRWAHGHSMLGLPLGVGVGGGLGVKKSKRYIRFKDTVSFGHYLSEAPL